MRSEIPTTTGRQTFVLSLNLSFKLRSFPVKRGKEKERKGKEKKESYMKRFRIALDAIITLFSFRKFPFTKVESLWVLGKLPTWKENGFNT